ncbi:hypothetical protein BDV23DRAFT_162502 [Aspergillus alliaceus]|uniref:Uncharacterized protein n=1 Tax=Petromyces alliaceus TaxID=209559 RepID=A0A5N7BYB5_PETAA|nr:hypothetical protein BDV23DRAFT_162502 [Aspergillus alliaceus]
MKLPPRWRGGITGAHSGRAPRPRRQVECRSDGHVCDNWKSGIGRPEKQGDGSFLVRIPEERGQPLPWVVTKGDNGIFVKILLKQGPGKHVLGFS